MPQREKLPDDYHMTIAQINGRFYPLHTRLDEHGAYKYLSQYDWHFEATYSIPPALGPWHRTGIVSFPKYQSAIDFCHRDHEESTVVVNAGRMTTACEVYPERNAWYADEIETLVGTRPHIWPWLFDVRVSVSLPDGTQCSAESENMDDAWVDLYTLVCALMQETVYEPVAI